MYQVVINQPGESSIQDFFTRKSEAIRFIARETGVTQKSIANEVAARDNSEIKRDSVGFRVEIFFEA